MSKSAFAASALLAATVICSPALAQEAAPDPMATAQADSSEAAAQQVAAARQAAEAAQTAAPCVPKKKKKGFGLGSILKAASKSGLTGMVGGGLFGQAGAMTNAAINTGVGIAQSSSSAPKAQPGGC